MNRHVHQLIRDKRAWQEPLEPAEAAHESAIGAKGWYTRGYLPHHDQPGAIQMVTFRLADAMPASRRREWKALLAIKNPRQQRTELETYLDKGHGSCVLRNPCAAQAVETALLHGDGRHYRLAAWVVMPNHVHVLFELHDLPLGHLVKLWKGASANAINRLIGRSGTLWQREYWDRYLRDEEHFQKARHYLEWNPVKAGLARLPEDWSFSSAHPQWQWSAPNRYHGAHLVRKEAPEWSADIPVGKKRAPNANRQE